MAEFYIVWNEGRSEGFVTDSVEDAKQVRNGRFRGAYTTAGAAFSEAYDGEDLSIQSLDIEPIPAA